jgi:hypothetical protein
MHYAILIISESLVSTESYGKKKKQDCILLQYPTGKYYVKAKLRVWTLLG